mmetsp:Transcript_16834/g.38810  ORF Transcript_16834/g.38810 Transcript_16834/m.38810 type:complete len:151 (-) Transcript_16834:404-856(-)
MDVFKDVSEAKYAETEIDSTNGISHVAGHRQQDGVPRREELSMMKYELSHFFGIGLDQAEITNKGIEESSTDKGLQDHGPKECNGQTNLSKQHSQTNHGNVNSGENGENVKRVASLARQCATSSWTSVYHSLYLSTTSQKLGFGPSFFWR